MVGAGSSSGSAVGGFYAAAAASETDGETFDGETDFEDYEEWDYAEMFSTLYVCPFSSFAFTDLRISCDFICCSSLG